MRDDPRTSDESMRDRAARLKRENDRLRHALDAAKATAEIERKRADAAQESSRLAWNIAAGRRLPARSRA